MSFCTKCGTQVQENSNFCKQCGNTLQDVPQSTQNLSENNEANNIYNAKLDEMARARGVNMGAVKREISDKWVWTLACTPILWMILDNLIYNELGVSVICIAVNVIFVILDLNELKNKGYNPGGWVWFGFLLLPVYLFIRASKTNKKYSYAITWCALCVFYVYVV